MNSTEGLLVYHIDLKRAMWLPDYIESFSAELRTYGYNALLIEVEDKLVYPKHPDLAHRTARTAAQWKQTAAALRGLGFELIPMLPTLGHAEYVLETRGYEHLREHPDNSRLYNPLSDEVKQLLYHQLKTLVDCFEPERFVHICGDEPRGLGRGSAAECVAEQGVAGVYLQHMQPLVDYVVNQGLRPIIWSDILCAEPELLQQFPRSAVVADWEYHVTDRRTELKRIWGDDGNLWVTGASYPAAGKRFLDDFVLDAQYAQDGTLPGFFYTDLLLAYGYDVLCAPANRAAGDNVAAANPCKHIRNAYFFAEKAREQKQGVLLTSWAVRHAHPETTWLATFAAAPAAAGLEPEQVPAAFAAVNCPGKEKQMAAVAADLSLRVPLGEAKRLEIVRDALAQGQDLKTLLTAELEYVPSKPPGLEQPMSCADVKARRDRLALCCETLQHFECAGREAYWLEGAQLLRLSCDAVLSVLDPASSPAPPVLLKRLAELRARSAALFARTYAPASAAEEIEQRYGVYRDLLEAACRLSE